MRLIYTALIFTNLTTLAVAQKSFILHLQPKQGFVTLSAGVSLPTGAFANRTAGSEQAGLARPGSTLSVSVGYRVAGVVGLMGRFQKQENGMDASALLALPLLTRADRRLATTGQWTITSTLFGPYLSIPLGRFAVDVRALAGPSTAVCPANGIEGSLGTVSMSVQTSAGQAKSIACGGGLVLSYRLGRVLSAGLTADYTTARYNFTDMTTTINDGSQVRLTTVSGQKTISALSVTGGITYLFGNRYRPF